MKFGKETIIIACTIITVSVAVFATAGVPASAIGLGALILGLALEWAGQRWGWWRVGLVVVGVLSVGELAKRVGGDTGEVFEHPYSSWASALGYETYSVHTPWGVERGYLVPEAAQEVKALARERAVEIERSAPGTLQRVCSSWSIEATSVAVAELCSEIKEEIALESEVTESAAEAEVGAQLQEWERQGSEGELEESAVIRRIEALHQAGGPID